MQVNKITASLVYNNESIMVSEPESTLGNIKEESEEYSDTIHILFSSPKNITKGTVLATWKISKILPQIYTINLVDMQVESSE
jgi:hypothetical protein